MSDEQFEAFRSLLDAPAPATLTTYAADGSVTQTPVWFRWHDSTFEVVIAEGDPKLRNLRRDPRFILLVFEAVAPFRGIHVSGRAELVEMDVTEARRDIAGTRFAEQRKPKPGVLVRLTGPTRTWDLSGIVPDWPRGRMRTSAHCRRCRPVVGSKPSALGLARPTDGGTAMQSLTRRTSRAALVAVLLSVVFVAQVTAVSWSSRVPLTTSGNAFAHGLVTLGPTTAVALFDSGPHLYVRRTTNSGVNWSTKLRLTRADNGLNLWADIGGRLNFVDVAHDEYDFTTDTTNLRYRRSTNSGSSFGPAIVLRTLPGGDSVSPGVGRGPDDVVAVAWHEINTNTIRIRVSTDGGASFGAEQTLATVTGTWMHPPAVAVGDGVIYAAYHVNDNKIRLRRSLDDGATWGAPVKLGNNGTESPTIDTMTATADGARAYIGFTVSNGTNSWTRYRRTDNSGGSWSAQVDISPPSSNPGLSVELTLQGTELHAVYEQCSVPSCNGSAVMYRSRTTTTGWTAPEVASHAAPDWASPAGVGQAGRVIVLYTADNGENIPTEPNSDVFVRTGTP